MLFKDISYLELWWLFCSAEWNHLNDLGREHHVEQFCKFTWFRRNIIQQYFLSRAMAAPLFRGVEPFVQFWYKASLGSLV